MLNGVTADVGAAAATAAQTARRDANDFILLAMMFTMLKSNL